MKLPVNLAFAIFMMVILPSGRADETADAEAGRIAARFVQLAGSEDNALALVLALRNGAPVQLLAPADGDQALAETIAVEVPTGPMAWSDVRIALLHAQDVLLQAQITRPTPDAVEAALLGGEVRLPGGRRTRLRGVLRMRADGLSWVDIARLTSPASANPR